MSKHTPGPWLVEEDETGDQSGLECVVVVDKSENYHISTCQFDGIDGHSNGGNPDYETAKANASLIAAAPELLKALKFCVGEFYQYDDANDPDGATEKARIKAIKLAEKAIAKAEGKS